MNKKKFNVIKNISVVICILLFAIITYIELRGQYLEYAELGTQYIQTFWTNIKYKYSIMGITFILVSIMMLITNFGIKKGLKVFFDKEKKKHRFFKQLCDVPETKSALFPLYIFVA